MNWQIMKVYCKNNFVRKLDRSFLVKTPRFQSDRSKSSDFWNSFDSANHVTLRSTGRLTTVLPSSFRGGFSLQVSNPQGDRRLVVKPSLKLTAIAHENRQGPKRKLSYSNSSFSRGELLVSGRVHEITREQFWPGGPNVHSSTKVVHLLGSP